MRYLIIFIFLLTQCRTFDAPKNFLNDIPGAGGPSMYTWQNISHPTLSQITITNSYDLFLKDNTLSLLYQDRNSSSSYLASFDKNTWTSYALSEMYSMLNDGSKKESIYHLDYYKDKEEYIISFSTIDSVNFLNIYEYTSSKWNLTQKKALDFKVDVNTCATNDYILYAEGTELQLKTLNTEAASRSIHSSYTPGTPFLIQNNILLFVSAGIIRIYDIAESVSKSVFSFVLSRPTSLHMSAYKNNTALAVFEDSDKSFQIVQLDPATAKETILTPESLSGTKPKIVYNNNQDIVYIIYTGKDGLTYVLSSSDLKTFTQVGITAIHPTAITDIKALIHNNILTISYVDSYKSLYIVQYKEGGQDTSVIKSASPNPLILSQLNKFTIPINKTFSLYGKSTSGIVNYQWSTSSESAYIENPTSPNTVITFKKSGKSTLYLKTITADGVEKTKSMTIDVLDFVIPETITLKYTYNIAKLKANSNLWQFDTDTTYSISQGEDIIIADVPLSKSENSFSFDIVLDYDYFMEEDIKYEFELTINDPRKNFLKKTFSYTMKTGITDSEIDIRINDDSTKWLLHSDATFIQLSFQISDIEKTLLYSMVPSDVIMNAKILVDGTTIYTREENFGSITMPGTTFSQSMVVNYQPNSTARHYIDVLLLLHSKGSETAYDFTALPIRITIPKPLISKNSSTREATYLIPLKLVGPLEKPKDREFKWIFTSDDK